MFCFKCEAMYRLISVFFIDTSCKLSSSSECLNFSYRTKKTFRVQCTLGLRARTNHSDKNLHGVTKVGFDLSLKLKHGVTWAWILIGVLWRAIAAKSDCRSRYIECGPSKEMTGCVWCEMLLFSEFTQSQYLRD